MSEALVDRIAADVADRAAVDWDALEREIGTTEDRDWVACLRVLGQIAEVHAADAADPPEADTVGGGRPLSEVTTIERQEWWGRYRLVECVGEGGFGSVHRAWDPELEREVAIKILHARVSDARAQQALLREGRALAKVRDPHVVSVLGVESQHDQVALCMEFVHGETLEDVVRRHGTFSAREATLVGEDLCRALTAVHLAGYVHRDVKARNVMRETAGRIVLMDFGAGQQAEDLKVPGRTSMVGTPLYMAPEVMAGQPASASSDVYSVGVLLYHLVSGAYPVEGHSLDEIRIAHMQGKRRSLRELRPNLPSAFLRVVDRALEADPSRRYVSAAALLEALTLSEPAGRRSRAFLRASTIGILGFLTVGVFGFLTTSAFNQTIGRVAPFDREGPAVWIELGWRSLLTPVLYISLMLMLAWSGRFVISLLSLWSAFRDRLKAVRARLARVGDALNLEDPAVFAQAVATVGVVGLATIIWRFSALLIACVSWTISEQPAELLQPLQTGHSGSLYRVLLDVLILVFSLAIARLLRLQTNQGARRRALAPIVALLTITVLMNEVPYRLLWHNEGERLQVAGVRCYVLGQVDEEALVYCPDREPPRNQVIRLDAAGVERSGRVESIFTPAGQEKE